MAGRPGEGPARRGRRRGDGQVHGFKTATSEELPEAVVVMDPCYVAGLAGEALDQCRRRVQQDTHGHRGRSGAPLHCARRTLHTGGDLLTDKQKRRLDTLFATDEHVHVEATWRFYQQMITAVLAYVDRPGTSDGPTEAINGRLEHPRGSALGFRNLTNYIARTPP